MYCCFIIIRDITEQWEYYMAFNINERDATGQNILYVASLLGNKKLLDVILKFRVKASRINPVNIFLIVWLTFRNNLMIF